MKAYVSKLKSLLIAFVAGTIFGMLFVGNTLSPIQENEAAASKVPTQYRYAVQMHELDCLAKNIYFEARGEPLAGKLAVGLVVLNRTTSNKYPSKVCDVVQQGRYTGTTHSVKATSDSHICQFSWYCDGASDVPKDYDAWTESQYIAKIILERKVFDFTDKATHYHASKINPRWTPGLEKVASIGTHTFYREF